MSIAVSVVLCTRNRCEYLRTALATYSRICTSVPWELVIVDNGSTDSTSFIIRQFMRDSTARVVFCNAHVPGLSRARNVGWQAAAGEIVAFTDDDCYPNSDYIDMIRDTFSDSRIDYAGGRILLFDPTDCAVSIQTLDERRSIPPGRFVPPGLIQGANMAARRSVIEALGGFDEILGAGTAFPSEDTDFIGRAAAAGFIGAYDPKLLVFHHHRRRTKHQVRSLLRGYRKGAGAYYTKCTIDPRLRKDALKNWYWNARGNLIRSLQSPEHVMSVLYELEGALGYISTLFNARIRRASHGQ